MKAINAPFKNLKIHQPSLPEPKKTPAPEVQKVAASEGKLPVNRQARLIIAPVKCWTHKPIPVAEPSREPPEVAELRAQLKTERNAHAETRDSLGQCRNEVKALRERLETLRRTVQRLESVIAEKNSVIQQLEDIKL